LHVVLAETADQRVRDGDFPKAIDSGLPRDEILPNQASEPPTLSPVFDQLGVGDRTPGLEQLGLRMGGNVTSNLNVSGHRYLLGSGDRNGLQCRQAGITEWLSRSF
jgi:hypothetical protein